MRDSSWINNSRNVPYPTVVWPTPGTPVLPKLTFASISAFVIVPSGIGSEMVAQVDGVWVGQSLDVNEVCGDELCIWSGNEVWMFMTNDGSNTGSAEVVWVETSSSS